MRRFLAQAWAVILLLVAWYWWVRHSGLNAIVMVTPLAVARQLIHNPSEYLRPALHTIEVALFGMGGGLACGMLLAILAWMSRILAGLTIPLALLLTSVPVVCLIPVLTRLFGYDDRTVFVTVIILCFLPGFVFATSGMKALPPMAREYFVVQGAGWWNQLTRLALPAAVPSLAVALRVLSVQSVLSALVAEFLLQTGGLGFLIATSTSDLDMDQALAASVVTIGIGLTLYLVASLIERRIVKYYN
ncbi:MAG: ABC transporter permease subunit [Terriglobales bacterium]|jgi:ABC-type nitrate/sulfonate/bicarbonate transport system permease component